MLLIFSHSGNNVYLFPSALYWFSIPLAFFLALLPRFLMKAIKSYYWPSDIDILKEIRRSHPDLDFQHHPLLGGRNKRQDTTSLRESRPSSRAASRAAIYPLQALGHTGDMEAAGRSVTDMSLGGLQSTHRGFDFASEEGGVHMRRIQSNLSDRRMRTMDPDEQRSDPRETVSRHRSLSLFPSLRRSVRRKMRSQNSKPPKSPPEPPA